MAERTPRTIPLPQDAFPAFQALLEMGEDAVAQFAELLCSHPLDLAFAKVFSTVASQIGCPPATIHVISMGALIPLNGLRRRLEVSPAVFLDAVNRSVVKDAPEDWKARFLETWKTRVDSLLPFFEPDNFFSQASKAFDLLSERPAILRDARVLTELRPIYDEGKTKTLAHLQTNTLVLDYWDGNGRQTLHVSLDNDDLKALEEELNWAWQKVGISKQEALADNRNLVVYGDADEDRAGE